MKHVRCRRLRPGPGRLLASYEFDIAGLVSLESFHTERWALAKAMAGRIETAHRGIHGDMRKRALSFTECAGKP